MMSEKVDMDLIAQQDTSTNALTEVALGLSMAFFALLVIALISITLPKNTAAPANIETFILKQQAIEKETTGSDSMASSQHNMIVYYYRGRYVDSHLRPILPIHIEANKQVVLAVDANVTFDELLTLQKEFEHVELSLAKLTNDWKLAIVNNN